MRRVEGRKTWRKEKGEDGGRVGKGGVGGKEVGRDKG